MAWEKSLIDEAGQFIQYTLSWRKCYREFNSVIRAIPLSLKQLIQNTFTDDKKCKNKVIGNVLKCKLSYDLTHQQSVCNIYKQICVIIFNVQLKLEWRAFSVETLIMCVAAVLRESSLWILLRRARKHWISIHSSGLYSWINTYIPLLHLF